VHDPIAYTYEADTNCPACAEAAFGRDEFGDIGGSSEDGEGNPVGVIAPWDEWIEPSIVGRQTLACGSCGTEIDTYYDSDETLADAEEKGLADGRAAGSWVTDGNTTQATYRWLLTGIEDGNPEIMDSLPSAPLSGEWSDGMTPRKVLDQYGVSEDDYEADDILNAYEDGFSRGVVDEVERACRYQLDKDTEDENNG
jgi:hypothetical protein